MQLFPVFPLFASRRVFCLWAAILVIPAAAAAKPPADLGEIEVREGPLEGREPSLDPAAAATVIIPDETKDLDSSVPELIEQSAGVTVKRFGGLDDFSAVSLRGSTAAQVQVYLDDIPLANSQGEPVDFSLIPLEIIDRIEVYRGGSPGMIPESTAGGVIVLRTKGRPERLSAAFRNTAGSFATYKGTASVTGKLKAISYAAAYERSQSDGDFTYVDDNGTTFNRADDRTVERANNDFASNSLFTKIRIGRTQRAGASISNIFFNKAQGIPGLGSSLSNDARLKSLREVASVSADKRFAQLKDLSAHADAFFDFLNSRFSDPKGEIGLGVEDNDDDTYRFGVNVRVELPIGRHQTAKAFAAERSEFFLPVNRAASPSRGPTSRRHTLCAGAEDEISLLAERLKVIPSIRITSLFNDLSSADPSNPVASGGARRRSDHQLSAKVGVRADIFRPLAFTGNFYRGFRNPTFSELFGDRGTIVGNPGLSPEEAMNFDAGLAYRLQGGGPVAVAIEAIYFREAVKDLIQFVQTSQFTVRAQNMNQALIQGLELQARFAWRERLSARAAYTFQLAKDSSSLPATSGKYLPGRPRHELSSGIAWSEPWFDWFKTRLSADLNYMSGNFLDTQNLLSVEDRAIVGFGAALVFVKGITVSFAVKNLLDDRISDLVGFPLPGRSYWGTVEFKI